MKYVLAVSKNLIVSDKIGSIARSYGFDVIARTGDDAISKASVSRPVLIVVDLEENPQFIHELKKAGISSAVIAFYPHTKDDLRKSAALSGYNGLRIVPNSMLEATLKDFLGRLTAL